MTHRRATRHVGQLHTALAHTHSDSLLLLLEQKPSGPQPPLSPMLSSQCRLCSSQLLSRAAAQLSSAAALRRPFSSAQHVASSGMGTFRSAAKLAQRQRAAAAAGAEEFDYLRDEAARRLVERLQDITRTFPEALDLGSNSSNVLRALLAARDSSSSSAGSVLGSISTLHQLEPSENMLSRGSAELQQRARAAGLRVLPTLGALEGSALPFQDASLDLVLSSMALHWVNDVPGLLAEVRRVLKPDGAFLCTFLGGETLSELR